MRGGALMKLSRVLCLVALLGLSAVAAKADGSDPSVVIHKTACCSLEFTENTQADPLVIGPVAGTTDFLYTGTITLTDLFVEVSPTIAGQIYNGLSSSQYTFLGSVGPSIEGGVEFEFAGITNPGDDVGVTLTPEPGANVLFLTGLIFLAAGFGIRRRRASHN